MQSKLLALAALSSVVLAAPELKKRQATDPAQFSSAVSQLVDLYIPSDAAGPIESAIQSAAAESGITGDITSIINSGLAETSPPNYLTAVPTQYQDNMASLESAISELRGVASSGIPGAPVIYTDAGGAVVTSTLNAVVTTDSAGATIVGVTGPVTDDAGSVVAGVTSTISSQVTDASAAASTSLPSGAITTTDSEGATIIGLAAVTTDSAGSTITSVTSTVTPITSSGSGTASTTTTRTSTSTTAAPATTTGAGVPAAVAPGAAGIIGLVGLALAL